MAAGKAPDRLASTTKEARSPLGPVEFHESVESLVLRLGRRHSRRASTRGGQLLRDLFEGIAKAFAFSSRTVSHNEKTDYFKKRGPSRARVGGRTWPACDSRASRKANRAGRPCEDETVSPLDVGVSEGEVVSGTHSIRRRAPAARIGTHRLKASTTGLATPAAGVAAACHDSAVPPAAVPPAGLAAGDARGGPQAGRDRPAPAPARRHLRRGVPDHPLQPAGDGRLGRAGHGRGDARSRSR